MGRIHGGRAPDETLSRKKWEISIAPLHLEHGVHARFVSTSTRHPPRPRMATERKINKNARIATARLTAVPHELVLLCRINPN
jgi:hypothetical protein